MDITSRKGRRNSLNTRSKIGVVIAANLNFTPFYYRYEEIFVKERIDFDLILWNRSGAKTETRATHLFEYELRDDANNGDWKKIWKFEMFAQYAKRIIKKNHYEYLLFLGTNSGNGVFLANYLKRHYKNKFWIDVRDYTYEWFRPFSYLENKAIGAADVAVISSKGYLSFLPKDREYVIAHNIDWDSINKLSKMRKVSGDGHIRISFIGNMRYFEENYRFLNLMANDNRFLLQYFGTGCEKLKDYCEEKGITNVRFKGRFNREETANLYAETDIINNLYGNDQTYLKLALSNKLYYALFMGKPILVCENTFMEKVSAEGGIGFAIDYDDPLIKEKLIEFYKSFRPSTEKSEALKKRIRIEDDVFISSVMQCAHRTGRG